MPLSFYVQSPKMIGIVSIFGVSLQQGEFVMSRLAPWLY